jgi:hypothetical protein
VTACLALLCALLAQDTPVADSTTRLDILDRRITQQGFQAGAEVETGTDGSSGVLLRVGAAVRARGIDVRLRNVRGDVRFLADLSRIQERLRRRPLATPTPR